MADDRTTKGILGDITPRPSAKDIVPGETPFDDDAQVTDESAKESMAGGSRHDRSKHAGSRDVTEGTSTGTEVGGTRNYRTGSGATGGDIGNRPE
jgi:hypothetical protein